MNYEDLHEITRRQPFQPFRLFLTDGSSFNIWRQDGFILARRQLVIGLTTEAGGTDYDRTTTIGLVHIVRVESLELPVPPSNGQG